MSRRGFLMDFPQVVMLIFVVALAGVIIMLVQSSLNTQVQESEAFDTKGKAFYSDFTDRLPSNVDNGIIIFFFGFMMVILGVSWLLSSNPVAFWLMWVVVVIILAFAGFLANAWSSLMLEDFFGVTVSAMPMTNFLISYYPLIVGVMAFLMIIIFFAKPSEGGA